MNVSGVRPYAAFYDYNSIQLNEARNAQITAAGEANSVLSKELAEPVAEKVSAGEAQLSQNFRSFDFAQQFNPNETYELKGADSDINNLDIQRAVSDLDKDSMLRQYQYFVNSNPETAVNSAVRMNENFIL